MVNEKDELISKLGKNMETKKLKKQLKIKAKKQEKLSNKIINNLIGVKESFELPEKLMSLLLDEEKKKTLFNSFMEYDIDLSNDLFRDYFQEEHSNRKELKQDYTPDSICKIISKLQNKQNCILDVCSGTGALTLFSFQDNTNATFYCEELSSRAIPFLLFNLSIRNMNAFVIQKDVLKNEIINTFTIKKGEDFSAIAKSENIEDVKYNTIISNPPYSIEWQPKYDKRFEGYELAPKSKADFAFVLDMVYRLSDNGKAFIILPHGVLFRGQQEGKIRKQLIDNNLIDAVIGLPDKMFLNTTIPTLILILNKNKKDNNILFIDSSKNFIKQSKQNDMNEEQINKIIETYKERKQIEKYSYLSSREEIIKNDYNLNIPRYVDTTEEEPLPNLKEVVQDIIKIDNEIKECEKELKELIEQVEGTTPEMKKYYKESIAPFIELLGG